MIESINSCEISDIERRAIEAMEKLFTSNEHGVSFRDGGYVINLSHCELRKLPNCMKNLKNLILINLSYNKFRKFPKILTKMPWLRKIIMNGNEINTIPKKIGKIKNLKSLVIRNSHISIIPVEIKNLKELEILDLSLNDIRVIPHVIDYLKNLIELDLSHNAIEFLPDNLKNLHHLEILDFSWNKIRSFSNVPSTGKLKDFSCTNNGLKNFESFEIDLEHLNNFEIHGNPIKSFCGIPKHLLKHILADLNVNRHSYYNLNLSKIGRKLIMDLLGDDCFSPQSLVSGLIKDPNDITEEIKKISNNQVQFERIHNFYKKNIDEILHDLINKKKNLSEEMERLVHEGGLTHRQLLENHLPKNHPIFEMYNEEYSIRCESGLKILI